MRIQNNLISWASIYSLLDLATIIITQLYSSLPLLYNLNSINVFTLTSVLFLQLDRTYTGLQTLGAETVSCKYSHSFLQWLFFSSELFSDSELYLFQVVDVELHRNSFGEDYIPQPSSSKVTHRAASPMLATSLAQSYGRSSSPISHDPSVDKGIHTYKKIILLHKIMKNYI